tara:strand:- start:7 stop:633 length:627 start_codon:yes stop_codon:yes gene_type:complete
MSYPLIVKDDFFSDPDFISKLSKEFDYSISNKIYPGVRSQCFSKVNNKLFWYIGNRIFSLIHDNLPTYYHMKIAFQKIHPFVQDDKWNKKNLGWIHKDNCVFGGVIYLDKNPDKDAGTAIFKLKDGFDMQIDESEFVKRKLYSGEEVDDKEYNNAYNIIRDRYEETLRVPNVYNRLVLIPGDQTHAMITIGDKERNTIVFFCNQVNVT